jgi:hypothetical protein
MSDVSVEDGQVGPSFADDGFGREGFGREEGPIRVTQTVNQAQANNQSQQQQQNQGQLSPVSVTPTGTQNQNQTLGTPSVLIPLTTHTQVQGLISQLQSLLGL